MTSVRVYKDKMTHQEAIAEIIRCSGTQFDPRLAKSFIVDYFKDEWKE
jgi:HD-GYP domain-containing protein (c-di-GMP phosphodiesterase class II)